MFADTATTQYRDSNRIDAEDDSRTDRAARSHETGGGR